MPAASSSSPSTRARVRVEMEHEPEGTKAKLGSILEADEGQVEEDLERFRDLVESRETPTGTWRGRVESGRVVEDDPAPLRARPAVALEADPQGSASVRWRTGRFAIRHDRVHRAMGYTPSDNFPSSWRR